MLVLWFILGHRAFIYRVLEHLGLHVVTASGAKARRYGRKRTEIGARPMDSTRIIFTLTSIRILSNFNWKVVFVSRESATAFSS